MKKIVFIVAALAVGVVVAFALARQGESKLLSVNEVGADPGAYTGAITVTGIMGGVSQQDPSIFGVMDLKELQCKSANCNRIMIPVRYQGTQPVVGDEITMTGSFADMGRGYLFVAQSVKVVRNHKIGG